MIAINTAIFKIYSAKEIFFNTTTLLLFIIIEFKQTFDRLKNQIEQNKR